MKNFQIFFLLLVWIPLHTFADENANEGIKNGVLTAKFVTVQDITKNKSSQKEAVITARGNVVIKGDEFEMTTQEVQMNSLTKHTTVPLASKIIYTNTKDNTKTFIFAQSLEGFPQERRVNAKNMYLISDLASIRAKSAEVREPVSYFKGARFSACQMLKTENGEPCKVPWYGVAKFMNFNEETKILKAKHLVIKLHGVPLFYFPYIRLNLNKESDGFQNVGLVNASGQQGLQVNYMKKSKKFGKFVITPEFYLNENKANPNNSRGNNIKMVHTLEKHINKFDTQLHTEIKVAPSVIADLQNWQKKTENEQPPKATRYYINHKGLLFDKSSTTNTKLMLASDRSFRQLYNFAFENYFESNISHTRHKDNTLMFFDTTHYNPITENNKNTIPSIISSTYYNTIIEPKLMNHDIAVKGQVINFRRNVGLSGTRAGIELEGTRLFRKNGFEIQTNPNISLVHYLYQNDANQPATSTLYNKNPTRIVADFNATFSKVLLHRVGGFITQTKPVIFVDYTTSKTDGEISNEDSVANYVQDNNVFLRSQFNGIDLVDVGLKTAYGLDFSAKNSKNHQYNALIAQRYNTRSGMSSYVGNFKMNIGKISSSANFIIDNHTHKILRDNSHITLKPTRYLEYTLSHLYIDESLQKVAGLTLPTIENITHSIKIKKNNHNVFASITENPRFIGQDGKEIKKIMNTTYGIGYDSDCLLYRIGIQKNTFFNGREIISINAFLFEIRMMK